MAKTRQSAETRELDRTILVDGQPYNINAVEANRVKNALTIKNIGLTGIEKTTERVTFTGDDAAEVSIVSAETGGRFNKEIRVPKNAATDIKDINAESVLNYSDTIRAVLDKIQKGAISYSWNGTEAVPSAKITETNTFNYISIVTGAQGTSGAFASWNYNQKASSLTPYVPIYLYIELREDENDCITYFGTADSKTAITLAINSAALVEVANTANKVANSLAIQLNGGTTEGINKYTFDGSTAKNINITPGNIGAATLIPATGAAPLVNGTAKIGTDNTAARSDHVHPTDTSRAAKTHTHAAGDITSGTLAEACGGTGKSSLSAVTVGGATNANNLHIGNNVYKDGTYFQPKILTGTADPSKSTATAVKNAANGTIYIKYSS